VATKKAPKSKAARVSKANEDNLGKIGGGAQKSKKAGAIDSLIN